MRSPDCLVVMELAKRTNYIFGNVLGHTLRVFSDDNSPIELSK